MAILKHEYEISIWDEHLDSTGKKVETKGAIIGAHDMTYLGRAIKPNLKRETNGTNTLTFDMVETFFDSEKGEYVKNEFIDMLYNERKIKLHYKGKWYEFYIKNITEDKNIKEHTRSFTCTDSFIDELSRTGYGITFDTELYNNVDEVGNFSNEVLEDSIWDYRADLNSGDFTEFQEERCYKIPLSQFGGSLKAYPVNLKVDKTAYKRESDYFSGKNFDKEVNSEGFNSLTNIYSGETRQLEYGDDVSREREIFWDSYFKDNGSPLIDDSNLVEIKGDYIYVPFTYLSFIFGSIFSSAYHATEEPAKYGKFGDADLGFALQPVSKDPTDLIQFLFFNNDDEVLIDEEGYIANNDHHYVITVGQWSDALKKVFDKKIDSTDDKGLIHWQSERSDNAYTIKYTIKTNGTIDYTIDVRPDTKTIDDFCWYPAYYEGYLEQIGDTEVYGARNISITDRTEFNLDKEYYTTIYNNKATDFKGLYSEKEIDSRINDNFLPRIQSMEETRIVVPTLARNLIQNGENITKADGWEALTQNNTTEFDTGSYANLLTIAAKTTSDKDDKEDGQEDDEAINDFYLEFLSPNIMKCNDIDYEGYVSSDYALNFGLSSKEINIEKDKVYAIRICTGVWNVDNYTIYFRSKSNSDVQEEDIIVDKIEDVNLYKSTIQKYYEFLKNYSSKLTTKNTEEEFKNEMNQQIKIHDEKLTNRFEKFENVYLDTDINYIIYQIFMAANEEIPKDKKDVYVELPEDAYKSWQDSSYSENRSFGKGYNADLDKIIIGVGSIDINGNYTLSGTKVNSDEDSYISFADIFEKVEDKTIDFVPYAKESKVNIKDLTKTFHHKKVNGSWVWNEEDSEDDIEDIPYLLFKAKANISTPYVGLRVDSEPMTFDIESTSIEQYAETDKSGVKVEVYCEDDIGDKYLVNNANITVYKVDKNNFTEDYLTRVGWKIEESSGEGGSSTDATFTFYTGKDKEKYQMRGIDISQYQEGLNWDKFSGEFTDFVIIKSTQGTNFQDPLFENHVENCVKKKIPFGLYHFAASSSSTVDTEVDFCVKTVKIILDKIPNAWDYFQLPMFLDLEGAIENESADKRADYTKKFMSKLKDNGFYPGLYTNPANLIPMLQIDSKIVDDIFIWLAHWASDPYSIYNGHREMWQIQAKSFPFHSNVDYNYAYVKPIKGLQDNAKNGSTEAANLSFNDFYNEPVQLLSDTDSENKEEENTEEKKSIKKEDLNIKAPKEKFDIHGGKRTEKITNIIIHSVGCGVEDPYYWEATWKAGAAAGKPVSAHYVVGKNETVQYVADDCVAWHAGDRNANSIGIEQSEPSCMNYEKIAGTDIFSAYFTVDKSKKDYFINYTKAIFERTAKLAAYLCQQYNLEVNKDTIQFHNSTTHFNNSSEIGNHHVDPLHLWGEVTVGDKTFGQLVDGKKKENLKTDLTMESFIERVKAYYDGTATSTSSNAEQDKINRENPNNDYTLRDGDLLTTAKPCWTATTFEDVATYCSNISPKYGDTCSLAYALFVNNLYYGIFWLDEVNGTTIDDPNKTIIDLPEDGKYVRLVLNYAIYKDEEKKETYKLNERFCNNIKFEIISLNNVELKSEYFSLTGNLSEDKKSMSFVSVNKPFVMYNLPNGSYQVKINLSNLSERITPVSNDMFKIDADNIVCNFDVSDGKLVQKVDEINTLSLDILYTPYYRFIFSGTAEINKDILLSIQNTQNKTYNYNLDDVITNATIEKAKSNNAVVLKSGTNIIDIIDLPEINDTESYHMLMIDKASQKTLIEITADNSDVVIDKSDKSGTILRYNMKKFNTDNDDKIMTAIKINADKN